ncbi:MAG: hypothetical protein NPIRA03_09660 [Nitrospirales bacterium]|nr:MAG: hypothetical protein NPIRA03_09660 [Nitrospirales bacterium]
MAETLIVCPNCKKIFKSPISFGDRKSFESAMLAGNTVNCPQCRQRVFCNKENMIFKEDK